MAINWSLSLLAKKTKDIFEPVVSGDIYSKDEFEYNLIVLVNNGSQLLPSSHFEEANKKQSPRARLLKSP